MPFEAGGFPILLEDARFQVGKVVELRRPGMRAHTVLLTLLDRSGHQNRDTTLQTNKRYKFVSTQNER